MGRMGHDNVERLRSIALSCFKFVGLCLILSNSYNSVDNAPVCVSAFLDCSFSIRGRDALHTRLSASILKLAVCTVELVVAPYAR